MRNRSIRGLSMLAASVAVSSALGLAGATAASASTHVRPHATTVCNNSSMPCTNISNLLLNQGNGPDYVQNASQKGVVAPSLYQGRKVNLRQASNSRTNEDFVIRFVGVLGQLCGSGGVNSIDPTNYACLNYPDFYPVYQGQFAPNSNESGFCVGALAATEGFKARLERCGSPKSFFVADLGAQITITLPAPFQPLVYFPLEFAADTSASNPLVLTENPNSKNPTNLLTLQQENFQGGQVPDRQMFTLTDPVGFTFQP
jgi:hypothetical protein